MTTPHSEKTVSARRRLFQIMAVGGAAAVVLPEKWVKPVIDAVILPAHAAGSVVRVGGIFGNQGPLFVASNQGNVLDRFAGMLMGSAHAAIVLPSCGAENTLCIAFEIAALPSTSVQVYVGGSLGSASISSGNAITDVTVNGLAFSNLIATTAAVSGNVTSTNPSCLTGPITLPKRTVLACSAPPA